MPLVLRGKCLMVRPETGELIVMLDDNGPDEWRYRGGPKSVSVIGSPFERGEFEVDRRCRITIEPDEGP